MRSYTTYGPEKQIPIDFCNAIVNDITHDYDWDVATSEFGEFLAVILRHDWEGFGSHILWRQKYKLTKEEAPLVKAEVEEHRSRCQAVSQVFQRAATAAKTYGKNIDLQLIARELETIGAKSCLVVSSFSLLRLGLIEAGRRGDDSWMICATKPVLLIETFYEGS